MGRAGYGIDANKSVCGEGAGGEGGAVAARACAVCAYWEDVVYKRCVVVVKVHMCAIERGCGLWGGWMWCMYCPYFQTR